MPFASDADIIVQALNHFYEQSLSGEGPVIRWVANHRLHHARSDEQGDPHTPRDGFWWSHMLWVFPRETGKEKRALNLRWAPDSLL